MDKRNKLIPVQQGLAEGDILQVVGPFLHDSFLVVPFLVVPFLVAPYLSFVAVGDSLVAGGDILQVVAPCLVGPFLVGPWLSHV